jgi:hypothetical protein
MSSIVQSIEYVTIDYDVSNQPVTLNLTKGQDETKCVPFFSQQLLTGSLGDDWRQRLCKLEIIDNAGTAAVKATAAGKTDTDDQRLKIFVVEFVAAINVQQVAADLADTVLSANITIANVGAQADAFFFATYDFTDAVAIDGSDNGCVRARWNGASTTSITLDRDGPDGALDGVLYVVDCDSAQFIVNHREIAMGTTDEIVTDTISATVLADTFIIHSYKSAETNDDPRDASAVADLSATTTIRLRKAILGSVATGSDHQVQVVECQNNEWLVERGDFVSTVTNPDATTITGINQVKSIVKTGCHISSCYDMGTSDKTAGNPVADLALAVDFNSSTELGWDRQQTNEVGNVVPFEVIDFTGAAVSLTSNGTPSIDIITANGLSNLFGGTEGLPTIVEITASGVSGLVVSSLTSTGAPSLLEAVSSGVVNIIKKANGSLSIAEITAAGVSSLGVVVKTSSGTPVLEGIVASGISEKPLALSGTPSIDRITASGISASFGIIKSSSGTPSILEIEVLGVSTILVDPASTPTTSYSGKIDLDLARPGDIKDPATDRAINFLHDAVEQLSLSVVTEFESIIKGYGGIKQTATPGMTNLGVGFQVVPADAKLITTPIEVTQNFANDGILVERSGVWRIDIIISLSHNEDIAGRTIEVQLYNDTDAVEIDVILVPIARNQPRTFISLTLMVEIPESAENDLLQIRIGNGSTVTSVVLQAYQFSVNYISEFQG